MTKQLTDEELAELERRVRPGYVELFPHEAASLIAEVRELRAFKARVAGYRKRLAAAIIEEYCDNNGYPSRVRELVEGIKSGEFNFDAAIFGAPAEGGAR